MQTLNHPNVYRVGNFKKVAAESMIEYGLSPDKAVAWAYEGERRPEEFEVKSLDTNEPFGILFSANMIVEKGPLDLIAATTLLANRGLDIRTTIAGTGPVLDEARRQAAQIGDGIVDVLGSVSNHEILDLLRGATLYCLPTHHEFAEGMPLSLTEALASRTPAIISDQPVFTGVFKDGEGVRIVSDKNPEAIAGAVEDMVRSPQVYRQFSESTREAFNRVHCDTTFDELLTEWKARF
jgi:glycosyltransferase involved in cell wall biosynthesis